MALPGTALGASTAEIATNGNGPFVRVNGDAADNEISVTLSGGHLHDHRHDRRHRGAGLHPGRHRRHLSRPRASTSPSSTAERAATPSLGSSGSDRLNGGPGPDDIDGRDGNDILNSGSGGIDPDLCLDTPPFRCFDQVNGGGSGGRLGPAHLRRPHGRVTTDLRPGREFANDDDGTVDGIGSIEGVVGGLAADELIGGLGPDYFNGGPGTAGDTLCGGLGKDTVDYSDKTAGVTVTLDGVLPTDPDIIGDTAGRLGRRPPGLPAREEDPRRRCRQRAAVHRSERAGLPGRPAARLHRGRRRPRRERLHRRGHREHRRARRTTTS